MEREALTETLRETLAPFDPSGEPRTTPEVADELDLAPSTFHQHLRKAQRKAFDVLLSPSLPSGVS